MTYLMFLGGMFLGGIIGASFLYFRSGTGILIVDPNEATYDLQFNGPITSKTKRVILYVRIGNLKHDPARD